MSSYSNFQSDNKKYSVRNRNMYNPAFNPSVKTKGKHQQTSFMKNIAKFYYFAAWARWYPDLFLDMCKPTSGGIKLNPDQRVFLRVIFRFYSFYGVFPRGFSKTMLEVFGLELCAIFFPGIEVSLSAQTKEAAAGFIEAKHREFTKFYPILEKEILEKSFQKDSSRLTYVNNSMADSLPNSNSAKGQRRRRLNIEESALLNGEVFEDALKPVVNISRNTVGKTAMIDPQELNGQINFYSTAGFRGTEEYLRSLTMYKRMARLDGVMVMGADWHLACWFGRGKSKGDILKEKEDANPIYFAQNYESKWVGNNAQSLVDIKALLNCRTLEHPQFDNPKYDEIYLGVDVARSNKTGNNITAIIPLKVIRRKNGKIKELQAINIIEVSGLTKFTDQAIMVKKAKRQYSARVICVDTNGLGVGLMDELVKENTDDETGETFAALGTLNTDVQCDDRNAERCIFDLKPQSANTQLITTFIDAVEGAQLRLLLQKSKSEYELKDLEAKKQNVLPFLLTDNLIEEITNLKLEPSPNGRLSIKQLTKKTDKDKFSALHYVVWYVKTFEETIVEKEDSVDDMLACLIT